MRFVKMHGLGNDFVVLDLRGPVTAAVPGPALDPALIRRLADRRRGIGCDQVLALEPARANGTDVYYRIYNSDGSEAQQCGNGVRCLARLLHDADPSSAQFVLDSAGGAVRARVGEDGTVAVEMPEPDFRPARVPFETQAQAKSYTLACNGAAVEIGVVSMGNPHAVVLVDSARNAPVESLGRCIGSHRRFADGANVGFCQVVDRAHVLLRVYERGVGETLACGTGACAAVAVAHNLGKVDHRVDVALPGGTLVVSWAGPGAPLWMTGPAETVFEGQISV